MGEIGKVVEINGRSAVVSLERKEACAECRACAVGMRKEEMLLTAANEAEAALGDDVRVELADGAFLKAAWLMYGLPLLLLLAGFGLGAVVPLVGGPLLGIALGAAGLAAGAYIIRRKERERTHRDAFTPYIAEVVTRA